MKLLLEHIRLREGSLRILNIHVEARLRSELLYSSLLSLFKLVAGFRRNKILLLLHGESLLLRQNLLRQRLLTRLWNLLHLLGHLLHLLNLLDRLLTLLWNLLLHLLHLLDRLLRRLSNLLNLLLHLLGRLRLDLLARLWNLLLKLLNSVLLHLV